MAEGTADEKYQKQYASLAFFCYFHEDPDAPRDTISQALEKRIKDPIVGTGLNVGIFFDAERYNNEQDYRKRADRMYETHVATAKSLGLSIPANGDIIAQEEKFLEHLQRGFKVLRTLSETCYDKVQ